MDGLQFGLARVYKRTAPASGSGTGAGFNLDPGGQSDLVGWTEAIPVFTLVPKPFNILYPAPGVSIPRSPKFHPGVLPPLPWWWHC